MKASAYFFLFSLILVTALHTRADMHGVYYIGAHGTKPGGGNPEFQSLKAACDSLNANTGLITGDCIFLISSDLTETANAALGAFSGGYSITFKPAPHVSPVILFTKTADNSGVSGAWVIGSTDLTKSTAVTVNKIVIDGSNTPGGTARDLTIATSAACSGNTMPIRLYGDVNSSVIKNCIIKTGNAASYTVLLTVRNAGGTNYVPRDITIENCAISNTSGPSGQAVAISNSGTPGAYPTGIAIRNNLIEAAYRGVFLNYAGNTEISGNEIRISQVHSGAMSYGIHGAIIGSASDTTAIFNNRLTSLVLADCAAGSEAGITGIHCGSKGVYNVFNNMIAGFDVSGPDVPVKVIGIRTTVGANIFFNSIYLRGLGRPQADSQLFCGVYASGGATVMKNNIICSHEEVDSSFGVWFAGGTLTADYNDYYIAGIKGCTGSWRGVPQDNLADWQEASGGDAHSRAADPAFSFGSTGSWMSGTDLHWMQVPSSQFAGIAITGIVTDCDGDPRHAVPTKGADESDVPLPVELSSFTAESSGGLTILRWTTASESNNHGFEVERGTLKDCFDNQTGVREWKTAGFVPGHGTSNLPHFYEFTDNAPDACTRFRLKQIDRDGGIRYSREIDAARPDEALSYALEQNFPNPFNPETEMKFTIPVQQHVRLGVYDAAGRKVATLVDTVRQPGTYSVMWDARRQPAGIYFYRMQAGPFTSVKKLVLIK
jgi:hypothetical protein